jgi:tetratricopeptide (TPR) repeat protein
MAALASLEKAPLSRVRARGTSTRQIRLITLNFEPGGLLHYAAAMFRLRAIGICALLFLIVACGGGCSPGDSHADEEKDPHFQRGRALASSQEFKQAADEFEKALESNPRSAAAHFELGWLYDTKVNDFAAAIYHYQKHLEFEPESPRAALVKDRIRGCKEELAKTEFSLPNGRNWQKDVDRLTAENSALKQQVESLRSQLATATGVAPSRAGPAYYVAPTAGDQPAARRADQPAAAPHGRTHIVQAHETMSSIAAEYGLKSSALQQANPDVNPRRMRVGQSLNLP